MPVTLTITDQSRIAAEAAESFTEAYYNALSASRHTIASFYCNPSEDPTPGAAIPFINYNGEVINNGNAFQNEYNKMPYSYYEVQCLNAHVLNPCIDPEATSSQKEAEKNVSIAVQVSGYVRLMERKEGPMRGFADHLVLVPGKSAKGKAQSDSRQWVIQTQTFRFVV